MNATGYIIAALSGLWLLTGLAGGIAYYVERDNYLEQKAGRIADAKAAEDAADQKIAAAKTISDADLAALNAQLAAQAAVPAQYIDRIIKVPVTTACAKSPAMQDATQAVHDLVLGK